MMPVFPLGRRQRHRFELLIANSHLEEFVARGAPLDDDTSPVPQGSMTGPLFSPLPAWEGDFNGRWKCVIIINRGL